MSDSYGLSEDCPVCGQAISIVDYRQCPTCGDEMCFHCMENHVCDRCAVCRNVINKCEATYLDEYGVWVCGDDCHIEFLLNIIDEQQETIGRMKAEGVLIKAAKKAATTGNKIDLHEYLKLRKQYL